MAVSTAVLYYYSATVLAEHGSKYTAPQGSHAAHEWRDAFTRIVLLQLAAQVQAWLPMTKWSWQGGPSRSHALVQAWLPMTKWSWHGGPSHSHSDFFRLASHSGSFCHMPLTQVLPQAT